MNEMDPSDAKEYHNPQRCEAVGTELHDLDLRFDYQYSEFESPTLKYQRKNIIINCLRQNECLIAIQDDHNDTAYGQNPLIYIDLFN